MAAKPSFRYVTYVKASAERVWDALTDAGLSAQFWGHANVSNWQVGARWEHQRNDGSGIADVAGTVIESAPPHRLVITWAAPGEERAGGKSRVSFDIEAAGEVVRLTVTHRDLADEAERDAAAGGWAAVLSNLKTLLETGRPLPTPPWQFGASAASGETGTDGATNR